MCFPIILLSVSRDFNIDSRINQQAFDCATDADEEVSEFEEIEENVVEDTKKINETRETIGNWVLGI